MDFLKNTTLHVFLVLAAFVLSLDMFWLQFFPQGKDVELKEIICEPAAPDTLKIERYIGDLRCYFEFEIPSDTVPIEARICKHGSDSTGVTELSVFILSSNAGVSRLRLADPSRKDSTDSKFQWPFGSQLVIKRATSTGKPFTLGEWKFIPETGCGDSSSLAHKRFIYSAVWWVVFGLALFGLAYQTAMRVQKRVPPLTEEGFLEQIIASLELGPTGATGEQPVGFDIVLIRNILRQLAIQRVDSTIVWESLKMSPAQKYNYLKKAKQLLKDRLLYFGGAIDSGLQLLEGSLEQ